MSIYFIACGGFIKVGYSEDPEKRAANLFRSTSRYSAPRAAYEARGTQVLLGSIDGDKTDEFELHQALSDFDAGCEWFIDEPALRDYLLSLDDDRRRRFESLAREGGPIWQTLPRSEWGGHNYDLAVSGPLGLTLRQDAAEAAS